MILRKNIEWKGFHDKSIDQDFVLMQDAWQRLMSDSTSWQKTLENSHKLQSQSHVMSTFCQEMKNHLTQKVGFEGNTIIAPVLEVTTSCLQGKYGVEIRIESVNKDNSHSWVRISHGLNKLVTDLIDNEYDDNEQETSETKAEIFALKTKVLAFASRSKAKAKPRRSSTTCSSSRTVPFLEWTWNDIEPGAQFDQAYAVAKRLNTLLRHGELLREEDGAIEVWRLKDDLRIKFEYSQYWSDEWKSKVAGGARQHETISTLHWSVRTRHSLPPSSSRSCKTQSHWSYTAGQCVNSEHIGCAINLHSIMNSGLIPGGQIFSKRPTVFLTYVDPMNKEHKDPNVIDLDAPRLAGYKQKVWKKHQNTVYWVDIKLAQKKGLKFYPNKM